MTKKSITLEESFELVVSMFKETKYQLDETKKELELNKSWVKHHQKSVENKLAENGQLRKLLKRSYPYLMTLEPDDEIDMVDMDDLVDTIKSLIK